MFINQPLNKNKRIMEIVIYAKGLMKDKDDELLKEKQVFARCHITGKTDKIGKSKNEPTVCR